MSNRDAIMYDVAHNAINTMYVDAVKASIRAKDEIEKATINKEIAMYRWELEAMSGSNEEASLSVMEKAINYYSPILKKRYGTS